MLGFRFWTLDGHRLASQNHIFGGWEIGENHAVCQRDVFTMVAADRAAHRAPDPDCACGLYALHSCPERVGLGSTSVFGAVLAWGHIEVHHNGFRAEHAEPVLLGYDPTQPYRHVEILKAVGGEFGVPVVDVDELEDRALWLGKPIPEELRPTPPDPGPDRAARMNAYLMAHGGRMPGGARTGPPPDPRRQQWLEAQERWGVVGVVAALAGLACAVVNLWADGPWLTGWAGSVAVSWAAFARSRRYRRKLQRGS